MKEFCDLHVAESTMTSRGRLWTKAREAERALTSRALGCKLTGADSRKLSL